MMRSSPSSFSPASEFFDRWGKSYTPEEGANNVIDRTGVFALCIANDHVLMIWPKSASEVAELPGGGVDPGETFWQALVREVDEETGLSLDYEETEPCYMQSVRFYAENSDEFWFYDQSFYKLEGDVIEKMFFEGERITPEDGKCRWVPLDQIGQMQIHHMHKIAISAVLDSE